MKYLILCGSVTNVLKAKGCFDERHLYAQVGRAPSEITAKHGCSYTLETTVSPGTAVSELKAVKIKPTHIYAALPDGRLMEVSP